MKRTILLFVLIAIFTFQVDAQRNKRWKRYRYEVVAGLGVSNFMGELGGSDEIGSNFLKDFEFTMTRAALNVGIRYRILDKLSTKVGITYGRLRGDDALTNQEQRQNRNLNFYADIYEFSGQLEYSIVSEKVGHKYSLRRARGIKDLNLNTYFFAGLAGFYFNPYGQDPLSEEWVELQPLGTEGQGRIGSRDKYSLWQVAIPLGIGVKYGLDRVWSIGLEFGTRFTFTDYLDDVSKTYYDYDEMYAEDPLAARLGDPSLDRLEGKDISQSSVNQQRGDAKDDDMYMFLLVTLNYKLKTTRKGLPKFKMGRRSF